MIDFQRRAGLTLLSSALAGVAVLALSLAGPAQAQEGPGVTAQEVKVGAWFPLSGPNAVYGVPQRAGADAYFGLVNSQGGINGRKISYVVEDNAYNPQRTVAAARKLIGNDGVLALVSANGTSQSSAAFPFVLEEEKVPFLMPFASQLDWFYPPRPNLFGVQVPFEYQARAMGRMVAKDQARKVLIAYAAIPVFENVANNVAPGLKSAGSSATVEMYPIKIGTQDFAPIALDIVNKKPDAIVYYMLQQEMTVLTKELKRQNFQALTYTYSPNVVQSLIDLGGDSVEGMKGVSLVPPPEGDSPAIREYRDALAKFAPTEKPDFSSLTTFGQAKLFGEALKRVKGPINRKSLVDAIETMSDVETGIFPPVSFSSQRHMGLTKLVPVKVQGGKWVADGDLIEAEAQ